MTDTLTSAVTESDERPARRPNVVVRTVRGVFSLVTTLVLLSVSILAVILMVASGSGQYRTSVVLTGSMANLYPPGTVVLLERKSSAEVCEGDVVAFVPPGSGATVLHRVVKVLDEKADLSAAATDQVDVSEGAGATDRVATSRAGALLEAPSIPCSTQEGPLVVTKGDTNPLVDQWSPMRLNGSVFVPKTVPALAPKAELLFGKQIVWVLANPWAMRAIAGASMLLVGWPLLSRMWRSGAVPVDEVEDIDDDLGGAADPEFERFEQDPDKEFEEFGTNRRELLRSRRR